MKKILLIHRYYYPDTPTYAFLLHRIALSLAGSFKVSVLSTFPSYYGSKDKKVRKHEIINGVTIRRLSLIDEKNRKIVLRIINTIIYSVKLFVYILKNRKRIDIIQIATTPPILPTLAVNISSRLISKKYIYHCQDIYPESVTINKNERFFYRLLKKVDTYNMNNAEKVVVLSSDMKELLISKRNINKSKIEIINNFTFNRKIAHESNSGQNVIGKFKFLEKENVILFAGNLGYAQNLDILFQAIFNLVKDKRFYFIVVGEGVMKKYLMEKYRNSMIIFTGYMPNEFVQQIYKYIKFGIAPLNRGIENVAYPSKIISYLTAGVPVLTFSSESSEISKFINDGFGLNYSFNGIESLKNTISKMLVMTFDRDYIKKNSTEYFSEEKAIIKWIKLFNEI